jgi:translation initiation factor 3 subunit E
MALHDITGLMCNYFDRHLVLPLLEFLEAREIYPLEETLTAKLDLLSKTNMVDFQMDIYKKLHNLEDASDEVLAANADLQAMEARKLQVVASLDQISDEAAPILRITVENPQLVANLRAEKKFTIEHLMENYEV